MPKALLFLPLGERSRHAHSSDSRLDQDAHPRLRCDTLPPRRRLTTRRNPSADFDSGRDMEES